MTCGDSDALGSPCLILALALSYSRLSQQIFLDDKLYQTAHVSEKTALFLSYSPDRSDRSLPQCTMQPHKLSCWQSSRDGWAGGTARGEGKGLQRLLWAQQLTTT